MRNLKNTVVAEIRDTIFSKFLSFKSGVSLLSLNLVEIKEKMKS
jgi:hypothetical protein